MDAVGEHHAAVVAWAFEAPEVSAQDADIAERPGLHLLPQPLRRGIEPEDVSHLNDPAGLRGQLGQLLRFVRHQCERLLDEDILAGFEEFLGQWEMALCGRDDHGSIDLAGEVLVVRRKVVVLQAALARGIEGLRVQVGGEQFDLGLERIEDAEVVGTPATETEQKDFRHG